MAGIHDLDSARDAEIACAPGRGGALRVVSLSRHDAVLGARSSASRGSYRDSGQARDTSAFASSGAPEVRGHLFFRRRTSASRGCGWCPERPLRTRGRERSAPPHSNHPRRAGFLAPRTGRGRTESEVAGIRLGSGQPSGLQAGPWTSAGRGTASIATIVRVLADSGSTSGA